MDRTRWLWRASWVAGLTPLLAFTSSGRAAQSASAARSAPAASKTYISEFPHPRLIVQFHPDKRTPFTLDAVDAALRAGVHAIELDLRWRAGDQAVVASHARRALERRPTLGEVIERVLAYQNGSPAVQKDNLQFFLVLDLKESSPALHDGLVRVLRAHARRWSTAASPGGRPRGITVLLSGRTDGLVAWFPGAALDSLAIVEGRDYRGRIRNLSPAGAPFQWVALQHPSERGRVRALRRGWDLAGSGVFNVRVYDCGGALEECFRAGADAVNVNLADLAWAVGRADSVPAVRAGVRARDR